MGNNRPSFCFFKPENRISFYFHDYFAFFFVLFFAFSGSDSIFQGYSCSIRALELFTEETGGTGHSE